MVLHYGQSCSIQVQLGSAISFVLDSIRVILGGPKIASFPHLVKFRFSESFAVVSVTVNFSALS